jgi:hypothetical protein
VSSTSLLEGTFAAADAEWVPFDTTVFFRSPPTNEAAQDAWTKKPRLPRRTRALTDRPIVRYLGRDSVEETVEGWRPWTEVVAGWLRESRSPTVFVHVAFNAPPALWLGPTSPARLAGVGGDVRPSGRSGGRPDRSGRRGRRRSTIPAVPIRCTT